MPKAGRCQICNHPERERIELLRAGGAGINSLAAKFGVHRDAIWRHWQKHVSAETKATLIAGPVQLHELAIRASRENMSVLDYLAILRSQLMQQLTHVSGANNSYAVSRVGQTLLAVLQEIGRMTGEISRLSSVNLTQVSNQTLILNDPAIVAMQTAILGALQAHPEARRDVIAALRALESRDDAIDAIPPKLINGHPAALPASPNGLVTLEAAKG